MNKTIDVNKIAGMEIPTLVDVCPYCGKKLYIEEIEGFSIDSNGNMVELESVKVTCESEPDIDDPKYDEWFYSHTDMPYVHWLPVEEHVKNWLTGFGFYFVDPEAEQKKLARWVKAVKGE